MASAAITKKVVIWTEDEQLQKKNWPIPVTERINAIKNIKIAEKHIKLKIAITSKKIEYGKTS